MLKFRQLFVFLPCFTFCVAAHCATTAEQLGKLLLRENYSVVTQYFNKQYDEGKTSETTKDGWHPGIDYRAKTPLNVYSPVSGVVSSTSTPYETDPATGIRSGPAGRIGRVSVRIDGTDDYFIFLHLSEFSVTKGTRVEVDTKIGLTGATGADAPHLHVELRTGREQGAYYFKTSSDTGFNKNPTLAINSDRIVNATDEGESISLPTQYITYILTPGKLTGKEFTLEKTQWREFRFDAHLINHKPKETVAVKLSLRGGYRAYDLFGHDEFEPKEPKDVATGWLPLSTGSFQIFPDESEKHLPHWIPERTQLIRVPLIKQYGGVMVNAYDLPLGLDRVNKGETKPISFQLTPTADEKGKKGVRLTPTKPLTTGVYFAYSLPDDTEKYHGLVHGFMFAVGSPGV